MSFQLEVNDRYIPDPGIFGSDEEDVTVEYRMPHHGTQHFILPKGVKVMVTPHIDENYWMMRVPVSRRQAVVCFEKFMTIGIGFQVEDADWNTNLPWSMDADHIYDHIKCNKGQKHITRKKCIEAIQLLQAHIAAYLQKQKGVAEH